MRSKSSKPAPPAKPMRRGAPAPEPNKLTQPQLRWQRTQRYVPPRCRAADDIARGA